MAAIIVTIAVIILLRDFVKWCYPPTHDDAYWKEEDRKMQAEFDKVTKGYSSSL